ncbi:MAG TPA: hypothetical protein VE465_04100 [Streptosporangiaceae bacterium]|jgi:hypothetical protein|nr:hypothetical protein [Streptosporangiaceae bacterium]
MTPRLTGLLLTPIATASGYFGWLGWHRLKQIGPDGRMTGPYTAAQVIGFILTLAVITVAVTWWCENAWIAPVMTTAATTAYFSAEAATSSDNDGLWPIGAALVFIGTALGAIFISLMTRTVQRRFS